MAATLADNALRTPTSKPVSIPLRPSPMKLDPAAIAHSRLDQIKHAALMSPVNQNGSFEFDRVIKAGSVVKRTRKTKQWKPIYVVLRANLLSIYRDKDETKLRHQINLSDITAVARQRDSKKKMEHVFAIFSPARNYHLAAPTEKDAQEWVDLIRAEARIDEDDEEMILMSPVVEKKAFSRFDHQAKREHIGSSSSEAEPRPSSSIAPENMHSARRPSTLNYASNDHGSFSDFSDTYQTSSNGLPKSTQQNRNVSKQSNVGAIPDDERVIYHGWLNVLKAKGGVRQWKKVWVVLRPKALGIYKNDQEYSAIRIIPFESIIDAVDLDPVSRSKQYCMQVILEEKNLRFNAPDEDSLAKWLGAFKSLLVKRKEAGARAGNGQPGSRRPSSHQHSQKPTMLAQNPPAPVQPAH